MSTELWLVVLAVDLAIFAHVCVMAQEELGWIDATMLVMLCILAVVTWHWESLASLW